MVKGIIFSHAYANVNNFDYILGKMNLTGTMATLLITVIVILVCLAMHEAINKLYKAVSHKE